MKNFGKKNFKAASAASKTFAWVLSIMLVVTGIAPSFAENGKVGNAGVAKKAAASEQAGMKKTYANKATAVSKENTQKNNNNSVNIKAKEQKKKIFIADINKDFIEKYGKDLIIIKNSFDF